MRFVPAVVALLLGGCSIGHAPHAPVSNAQSAAIHAALKERTLGIGLRVPEGRRFYGCAERRLGAKQSNDELTVYLYYQCEIWGEPACTSAVSGISAPAVVHLRSEAVERWQLPGDGSRYARDIKAWFPRSLRKTAAFPGNQAVDRLSDEARRDARCRA